MLTLGYLGQAASHKKMASGNPFFDDIRIKPEVAPPQIEDILDINEHAEDPSQNAVKPNVAVSSSVRELLECPVCLNAMYPPIHQVFFCIFFYFYIFILSFFSSVLVDVILMRFNVNIYPF